MSQAYENVLYQPGVQQAAASTAPAILVSGLVEL
jgi:hypothetical protein